MGSFLESWIRGLAAAAIFSAAMLALAPKGSARRIVKLVCGALLTFVLLSPLKELSYDRLAEFIAETRLEGREIAASSEYEADLLMKLIIEDETEAYILDKAAKLGISVAKVEVALRDGAEYPYPWSAVISCEADAAQKDELSAFLEGELGIPKDRQAWNEGIDGTSTPD